MARLSVYYDNVYYKIALINFTHESTEFLPTLLKIDKCIIGPDVPTTIFFCYHLKTHHSNRPENIFPTQPLQFCHLREIVHFQRYLRVSSRRYP